MVGEIIETINGKNVVRMEATFIECCELITAPAIPSTIKYMYNVFTYCDNLTGEIEVNAVELISVYDDIGEMVNPIKLVGTASDSVKQKLASVYDNVTY